MFVVEDKSCWTTEVMNRRGTYIWIYVGVRMLNIWTYQLNLYPANAVRLHTCLPQTLKRIDHFDVYDLEVTI